MYNIILNFLIAVILRLLYLGAYQQPVPQSHQLQLQEIKKNSTRSKALLATKLK